MLLFPWTNYNSSSGKNNNMQGGGDWLIDSWNCVKNIIAMEIHMNMMSTNLNEQKSLVPIWLNEFPVVLLVINWFLMDWLLRKSHSMRDLEPGVWAICQRVQKWVYSSQPDPLFLQVFSYFFGNCVWGYPLWNVSLTKMMDRWDIWKAEWSPCSFLVGETRELPGCRCFWIPLTCDPWQFD